jgi:parallel beta-helix repeat protein
MAPLDVRDFGARGDGLTDDTEAFNRAVVAASGGEGTVRVPRGVYLIDPVKSIQMLSKTSLSLAPAARLRALPVSSGTSAVIRMDGVTEVRIAGGTIEGERNQHRGNLGEWRMGIFLRGSTDVEISATEVLDCWGDGIYIGDFRGQPSKRITVRDCIFRRNRRQGMSITACEIALVESCQFLDTQGASPQAGVDVEPNAKKSVSQVVFRNCQARGNHGFGIVLSGNRSKSVSKIYLEGCTCTQNGLAGIAVLDSVDCRIEGSRSEANGRQGIMVAGSERSSIRNNAIRSNGVRKSGTWDNLILQSGTSDAEVVDNSFVDEGPSQGTPRFDIRVEKGCVANRLDGNTLRPKAGSRTKPSGGISDLGTGTILDKGSNLLTSPPFTVPDVRGDDIFRDTRIGLRSPRTINRQSEG